MPRPRNRARPWRRKGQAQRSERETLENAVEEQRNLLFGAMTRLTEIKNSITERERALKERLVRQQRRLEEERALSEKLRFLEEKVASLRLAREQELAESARMEAEEKDLTGRCERGVAGKSGSCGAPWRD